MTILGIEIYNDVFSYTVCINKNGTSGGKSFRYEIFSNDICMWYQIKVEIFFLADTLYFV